MAMADRDTNTGGPTAERHGERLWEILDDYECWPGRRLVLSQLRPREGSEIRMLGHDAPLPWSFDSGEGLSIELPEVLQEESGRPCKYAYTFKVRVGDS